MAGALLYYGFNFLRGTNLFSPADTFYVVYPNVSGLNVSNPIYFNGLPVGRVSGFQLDQKRSRIIVSLDIDRNVTVSKYDTAKLTNDGLLGGKAIVLRPGSVAEPIQVGDTLLSEIDGGLLDEFEPVAADLRTTVVKINTLLDSLNRTDLAGAVEGIKKTLSLLNEKIEETDISGTLDSVKVLSASFKARSEQLKLVLEGSNGLIDSLRSLPLNETVSSLTETLDGINDLMANVQSENGTIGKLLTNDSIYNSLNKLLVDLDELAIHFNNYPRDFMKPLGRKNKKLKGVSQEGN